MSTATYLVKYLMSISVTMICGHNSLPTHRPRMRNTMLHNFKASCRRVKLISSILFHCVTIFCGKLIINSAPIVRCRWLVLVFYFINQIPDISPRGVRLTQYCNWFCVIFYGIFGCCHFLCVSHFSRAQSSDNLINLHELLSNGAQFFFLLRFVPEINFLTKSSSCCARWKEYE